MIEFHYSLSKKQSTGVRNSTVTQFPLRLAFAATAHKVQGQTVKKPNSLVLDLRTVRESAQAYVMLSRVQSLEQLFILGSLPADKIYSSKTALDELERLRSISLNRKNLSNKFLVSCNIRSLKAHFQDISTSPYIEKAEVICLQETWSKENFNHVNEFNIPGFNSHLNCGGLGKGIVTYCTEKYSLLKDIKRENHQMSVVASLELDVINVYRSSSSENPSVFIEDLLSVFDNQRRTLIAGDLNICYAAEDNHPIIRKLKSLKFTQNVKSVSHVQGRIIDHVYHFSPFSDANPQLEVHQFGQFFTDHDLMVIDISDFDGDNQ